MSEELNIDDAKVQEALKELEARQKAHDARQTVKGCLWLIVLLMAFIDIIFINSALLGLLLKVFDVI